MNLPTSHSPAQLQADVAIQLDRVSVRYRIMEQPETTLKAYAVQLFRRQLRFRERWALRDVDLCVKRGEVFGIIGANGAGKSTLLRVIARVIHPTNGRVRVRGRVAPLIELGTGFNPELTGRENIFLKSAMLGFSRHDTAARLNRVVEFAGLQEHIDAPVRTYSTGMTARLGFAVATDVQPDVLIVDEILSVGDGEFQRRSYERILRFRENGATILIVSHNLETLRGLCDRIAWLDLGTHRRTPGASESLRRRGAWNRRLNQPAFSCSSTCQRPQGLPSANCSNNNSCPMRCARPGSPRICTSA
jgi:ABC-type polysaccharide/polyol phosphate transport system ATPase subunit